MGRRDLPIALLQPKGQTNYFLCSTIEQGLAAPQLFQSHFIKTFHWDPFQPLSFFPPSVGRTLYNDFFSLIYPAMEWQEIVFLFQTFLDSLYSYSNQVTQSRQSLCFNSVLSRVVVESFVLFAFLCVPALRSLIKVQNFILPIVSCNWVEMLNLSCDTFPAITARLCFEIWQIWSFIDPLMVFYHPARIQFVICLD